MWGCLGILIAIAFLDWILTWMGSNKGLIAGITGLALLVYAIKSWNTHRQKDDELFKLKTGSLLSVKELHEKAKYTGQRLEETGFFGQEVELSGVIRSKSPLISELAKKPCVYYSSKVTREYEETVYVTNDKGRRERKTERRSELVAANTRLADSFLLEDGSGMVVIRPEGAQVETIKVLDDFDYNDRQRPPRGSMTFTIGYHRQESILPVGQAIYVRGYATDSGGVLAVQKPPEKYSKFILSLSTRDEVLERLKRDVDDARLMAIGAGAIGGILLAVAPFLT